MNRRTLLVLFAILILATLVPAGIALAGKPKATSRPLTQQLLQGIASLKGNKITAGSGTTIDPIGPTKAEVANGSKKLTVHCYCPTGAAVCTVGTGGDMAQCQTTDDSACCEWELIEPEPSTEGSTGEKAR